MTALKNTVLEEKRYPLTKQQEGLWVEWKLHPKNTSYNTCVNLRLTGPLDKERFEKALYDAVNFFSSLRIYFAEEKGVPFQCEKPEAVFAMEFEDISIPGQSDETPQQHQQAIDFLARKVATPVDLKQFPIVHAGLIKTAPEVHYFIGMVPHMISDGASAVLFLEAASIAYEKGFDGLVEAYGATQKSWDEYFTEHPPKETPEAATYWQERLKGAQHTVNFNHGIAPQSESKSGKRVYFNLEEELSGKLKRYARSQRTTFFNVLSAALATMVNRLYGQDDLTIGYPVNIRPPGYKHLFGFFVNIVPLRIDSSGNPTFNALVDRISASRKADKQHQEFPALEIVRGIRRENSEFDGRVFNLSMAQTISRLVNLRIEGIESEPLEVTYNDVNDDLSLSYENLEDGCIGLWFEYRQALFEPEFISQLIEQMQSLFEQIIENPERGINEFLLLSLTQEKKLLNQWGQADKALDINAKSSITDLFEQAAAKQPNAIALIEDGKQFSYQTLNEQANQLARQLQAEDVKKGDKVAILLERGANLITSLLAIMKAGAAYVPLSPDYPAKRIAYILQDSGCDHVITQTNLKEKLPAEEVATLLIEEQRWQSQSTKNLPSVTQDADSYLIYTSGSTGNPKGVRLTHENVVPRLKWLQQEIPLSKADKILQNTDTTFDVSVAEIFWPLSAGASLVLTDSESYKDPSYLIDLIETHQITTSCMVPSLLTSLLAVLKDRKLSSLKHMLAAGEALPPSLVTRYYQQCSGTLYNVYGPTEGTIYSAFTKCENSTTSSIIPIGRPLGATSLYILDETLRPMPMGVAGELHIGGIGVAQGYVNLPDLTAERFIADPFTQDTNARLYKTGDLARFNSQGEIEYLERIDSQVKIRGFRIELAEIEAVMAQVAGVKDTAVIDIGSEHKRLAAYYVVEEGFELETLRKHICANLPSYMAPAFYVEADEIPRLASAKINRNALPKPEQKQQKRKAYRAASNDTETKLVALWSEILTLPADKIGVDDSFFELGGDSLMAIQLVCAAEEQGIYVETNSLFTHRTIAELATVAQDQPFAAANEATQEAIEGTYPLLPRQTKFFADGMVEPHHWNRFFWFDIDHNANPEQLKSAFDTVLMHHDNLRVRLTQNANGEWQQECLSTLPQVTYFFTYDIAALASEQQEPQMVETINKQQASLDLSTAPLLRIIHFKTGEESGKLAIIAHHLLLDMVSSRLIFEDFLKSYEGARLGIEMELAAKTTSIQQLTEAQRQQIETDDFTQELAYWGSAKMHPVPELPYDRVDDTADEASAHTHKTTLDESLTGALLKDLPAEKGWQIQDTLLTALSQTIREWTGKSEMLVNLCGHGRNGSDGINLSRTVGWVNTVYPAYLEVGDVDAIKQQLEQIPARNEAYNLLRYTARDSAITQHPTPQLFFNYVSQIDALLPEGLSITPQGEPAGIVSSAPSNPLCYGLYIEAAIVNKCLKLHFTYSNSRFNTETIEELSRHYISYLTQLIASKD